MTKRFSRSHLSQVLRTESFGSRCSMPAPTKPPPANGEPSGSQLQKPQKPTKAERRELHRAAKEGKQSGPQGSSSTSAKAPSTPVSASGMKKVTAKSGETFAKPSTSKPSKDSRDAASSVPADDREENSRGLRIFSHFGLQKPVISVKGDIHPAIIRLGLQFSEFKICGANARCIATLIAFKTVC